MVKVDTITRMLVGSASLVFVACGASNDTSDASADATADVVASDGGAETSAADATDAIACSPATFVMTKELLGDGNNGEWKSLGFDIDGLASTASSTDVCQPNSGGSPATAYPDGNNGIDNSFGKNILPLIVSLDPTWPTDVNNAIQSGLTSTLYEMSCVPPTGDAPSFLTKAFLATPLGGAPLFDGTDKWPVAPEILSNPVDPDSSIITFASASITGALFDSHANQTFALRFPFTSSGGSTPINLTIRAARVQMTLSQDRKSATSGIIGGVLKTEDLVSEVKKVGYANNLCSSSLLTSLITAIRQASDIMSDGTQNPSKTCDGISIGLGFEATLDQRGPVGPAAQALQSCP